ncbi:uncharacterized protein Dwil_GK27434 [Drosophila willistoni]|uniref:C-type lectin domain-containing protein n=1 Tax=Drosophila willistoni TaxID=7260 RepID=A0A0Q9WQA0_DROWI|nr:uncharacterized protein Dwil_GK27434 [Drosophila willistoni]
MAKTRSTEETLKEQRNLKDECQNELKSTKSLQSQLVDRSSLENLQYQLQQEEEKVKTCRASLRETDQTLGKEKRLKEECQNGKNQLSQELESTKSLQSQLVDRSSLENVESKLKNMEKQLKQEEGNVESCRASAKTTEGSLAQQQSLTQQCQNERRKFRKIGQKYYHIENSEGNTWFGALQRCAEWGGHLVSFQNEHEWNSVRAALKIYGSYWIDINDLNREGTFVSATSGNSPSFVRWYRGEPNNGFAAHWKPPEWYQFLALCTFCQKA